MKNILFAKVIKPFSINPMHITNIDILEVILIRFHDDGR
jgi:hypothetical protein